MTNLLLFFFRTAAGVFSFVFLLLVEHLPDKKGYGSNTFRSPRLQTDRRKERETSFTFSKPHRTPGIDTQGFSLRFTL